MTTFVHSKMGEGKSFDWRKRLWELSTEKFRQFVVMDQDKVGFCLRTPLEVQEDFKEDTKVVNQSEARADPDFKSRRRQDRRKAAPARSRNRGDGYARDIDLVGLETKFYAADKAPFDETRDKEAQIAWLEEEKTKQRQPNARDGDGELIDGSEAPAKKKSKRIKKVQRTVHLEMLGGQICACGALLSVKHKLICQIQGPWAE